MPTSIVRYMTRYARARPSAVTPLTSPKSSLAADIEATVRRRKGFHDLITRDRRLLHLIQRLKRVLVTLLPRAF